MRISLIATVIALCFFTVAADAQSGKGRAQASANNSHVSACASLRGGTPGLHGMCVAYCARRSQANVDMNDIASVRAAAPSVRLLERYNARKTPEDPAMPCFADDTPAPPDEPPVPTSCACWTAEQLQQIDGILDPVRGMTPGAQCTANDSDLGIYEAQVYEGYNVGTADETVVNSAFAYFDPNDPGVQGCMSQSPTEGILNFPLENRTEAQYCIQTIVDQCGSLDQ